MKKLIFLLLLILIATPVFAQQQEARMSLGVIGGGVPVAAGGPNVWYYSGEEASYNAGAGPDYALFNDVTAVAGGTVTQVAIHCLTVGSATLFKAALYWNNGGTWTKWGTEQTAAAATGWVAINLSAGYTIATSEVVRVVWAPNAAGGTYLLPETESTGGWYDSTFGYTTSPWDATLTESATWKGWDVGIYVD